MAGCLFDPIFDVRSTGRLFARKARELWPFEIEFEVPLLNSALCGYAVQHYA
jgi:hypothetical protein